MIDDSLLDLTADCYVALRACGYLREFPTFASFLRRAVGLELQTVPPQPPATRDLSRLAASLPPDPIVPN
jgi:hypothetical protein